MRKKLIALVGRPNVGKSSLFNRLSIRKKAIVHDKPGVTRDRKYGDSSLGSLDFITIDTPGLEESEAGMLEERMMQQTIEAIKEADLVALIVDAREGVTPADKFFANMIRKYNKNSILIANKAEKSLDHSGDYYKLGFGQPIPVSAQHGLGMADLYDAVAEKFGDEEELIGVSDGMKSNHVQIAVVGRPNAGKSTFINTIIGSHRLLTGPEAGITRESIEIEWEYKNQKMKLIDTAGLRKKGAISETLEKLSASDTIESINFANVVVLMVDSQIPLNQQDLNIANYTIDQGRSLVIAVNKWDLVKDKAAFEEEMDYMLSTNLPQVKGVPVVFLSAINNHNTTAVLDAAGAIYALWNKKISTSKLNQWLQFVTEEHPLPLQKGGRRIRIKYMTQTKIRPPTFKLFSNNPDKISDSYQKYLMNSLRESFGLDGVPIRFIFCKSENPYT